MSANFQPENGVNASEFLCNNCAWRSEMIIWGFSLKQIRILSHPPSFESSDIDPYPKTLQEMLRDQIMNNSMYYSVAPTVEDAASLKPHLHVTFIHSTIS